LSLQEQYRQCSAIKGVTAADASHFYFCSDAKYPDVAQLTVTVQKTTCAATGHASDLLLITLDGQDFIFDTTQVTHAALKRTETAAFAVSEGARTRRNLPPYVSFLFRHVTFNIYPAGYAAHSDEERLADVESLRRVMGLVVSTREAQAGTRPKDTRDPSAPPPSTSASTPSSSPSAQWGEWVAATGALAAEVRRVLGGYDLPRGEAAGIALPALTQLTRRCARSRKVDPSYDLQQTLSALEAEAQRLQHALFPQLSGHDPKVPRCAGEAADTVGELRDVLQQVEDAKDALLAASLLSSLV